MSKFLKISLMLVILFTSSCAMIFNKKDVEVNFKSIPDGADVYVDGDKVGKTPISVRIEPTRDRSILYIKDGYATREFEIKKIIGDSTLRPTSENVMCLLDAFPGMLLIVPLVSVFSNSCAHFDNISYSKALDKGTRMNVLNQSAE